MHDRREPIDWFKSAVLWLFVMRLKLTHRSFCSSTFFMAHSRQSPWRVLEALPGNNINYLWWGKTQNNLIVRVHLFSFFFSLVQSPVFSGSDFATVERSQTDPLLSLCQLLPFLSAVCETKRTSRFRMFPSSNTC